MDMNNHKTGESNTKRITNKRKKGRGRMRSMNREKESTLLFNIKSKGRRQGIEHQQQNGDGLKELKDLFLTKKKKEEYMMKRIKMKGTNIPIVLLNI